MAKKKRRRGEGPGTVYRRGHLWSIAWVATGAKQATDAAWIDALVGMDREAERASS